jgi:hypothetical protein
MTSFIFSVVVPLALTALFFIRLYFYFQYGNKNKSGPPGADLDPDNIEKTLTQPINYEAPKTLKEKVNRVWFFASFILIPLSLFIWGMMAYEIFSKTHTIFFPAIVSALFLLPVAVFCLICYVCIMFVVMLVHKKEGA